MKNDDSIIDKAIYPIPNTILFCDFIKDYFNFMLNLFIGYLELSVSQNNTG